MLKHISKLKLSFSPLDHSARSIRSFLVAIDSERNRSLNSKLIIEKTVSAQVKDPHLQVTYRDSKELNLETKWMDVQEILKAVNKYSKKLEILEVIKSSQ